MQHLLQRFSEPSSYAGLGGLLSMVGVNVPSGTIQSITFALAGLSGLAAFLLPEKKS